MVAEVWSESLLRRSDLQREDVALVLAVSLKVSNAVLIEHDSRHRKLGFHPFAAVGVARVPAAGAQREAARSDGQ